MGATITRPEAGKSARRTKIVMMVAAIIVLLPGLVMIVMYSRHRRVEVANPSDNVAERDKMAVAADQRLLLTGDLNQAEEDYQQIIARYPQGARAYDDVGVVYARLGQYTKAAEVTRMAMKLDPEAQSPYEHLAYYAMAAQHPEDAHQYIRDAQAKGFDGPAFHKVLYAQAFLAITGPDRPAIAEQVRWFAGHPDYESYGLSLASNTAAYSGHLTQARDFTRRAVDSAVQNGNQEAAAVWLENAALREAAFGNAVEARKQADAGLKLSSTSPDAEAEAAIALAMSGDGARSASLVQDLKRRFPSNTQLQSVWVATAEAQLALAKKNPDTAVDSLVPAAALELGETGFGPNPSCMYSTYLRGQAYLADQKGTAAAMEFQKILDHSGVVWNCWTGALAHLGLARANALAMQEVADEDVDAARLRAMMAYKDFLKLWKDADPDTPILKQAKDEAAKLQ